MLCLYVYNVLPPQRLPGSFEDLLCNGQRKIKETRFKKKKKKKKKEKEREIISGGLLDLIDILGFSQELKDGILYGTSVFLRGK